LYSNIYSVIVQHLCGGSQQIKQPAINTDNKYTNATKLKT